ncbi:MAG: YabP/YqfC family sporulation protein [Lachnospiraceae bacterium]|nr:YabP/YqfC family sporulation protein [Lachnospiraceae bacterium]
MRSKSGKSDYSIAKRIADAFQLPNDCILGSLNMMLTDKNQVYIENYRSILEYTDTVIKVLGKNCRVQILGEKIRIISYNHDTMLVKGKFDEIKYF